MEEKKEKKTIKCSYALLVIILFATVAFLTDYIIIDRKTRKCDCPKCEATNNEVISDNTDNTQVTDHIDCFKSFMDHCLIYDASMKIELIKKDSTKFNSVIINQNQYDFLIEDIIDNVVQTSDGNVFIEYLHNSLSYSILLDSNANVVSNFEELYENGYNNRVYYKDGIYKVISFKGDASPLRLCGSLIDENEIVDIIKEFKYVDGNLVLMEKSEISLKEYLNQEGYSSCSEVK